MISTKYVKANYTKAENYNSQLPNSYILYLDVNNLNGWSMHQSLPNGGFEQVSTNNITEEWILALEGDGEIGYIFQIDLEYFSHLHELHNEYPVSSEKVTVTAKMLSLFAKSMYGNKPYTETSKLVPNLNDKTNYFVHFTNLKFYLELELKLRNVHKVLKFS